MPRRYFCGVVENSKAIVAFATVLIYPSINALTGLLILDRPNGLTDVPFHTIGTINGTPSRFSCFVAFHLFPILRISQMASSVYMLMCAGVQPFASFSSGTVSMIAIPDLIRLFSPSHLAAAVIAE